MQHEIIPIVCVGESLEQNEAGETETFVSGQVRGAFKGISAEQAKGIIVAYERHERKTRDGREPARGGER